MDEKLKRNLTTSSSLVSSLSLKNLKKKQRSHSVESSRKEDVLFPSRSSRSIFSELTEQQSKLEFELEKYIQRNEYLKEQNSELKLEIADSRVKFHFNRIELFLLYIFKRKS
jgi:hypothetical protein